MAEAAGSSPASTTKFREEDMSSKEIFEKHTVKVRGIAQRNMKLKNYLLGCNRLYIKGAIKAGRRTFRMRWDDVPKNKNSPAEVIPYNGDKSFHVDKAYMERSLFPVDFKCFKSLMTAHAFIQDYFAETEWKSLKDLAKTQIGGEEVKAYANDEYVYDFSEEESEDCYELEYEWAKWANQKQEQKAFCYKQEKPQEKQNMNVIDSVVQRNKTAVTGAAALTAGKTINRVVTKKVAPLLPEGVQAYADSAIGRLVVANIIAALADTYKGTNSGKLRTASQFMVESAVFELVDNLQIDAVISDFLEDSTIQTALAEVVDET